MTRFFAFGCSYTFYSWPTWADFLSLSYPHYENWAIPGIGNQAIFERLVEANIKNKFNENDLIIVQWSGHLRHDWYTRQALKHTTSGWKTSGGIFSKKNEDILDLQWQTLFFDEFGYLMHSLNFIAAAIDLLKNTKAKFYMTSMSDIRSLGFDLYQDPDFPESASTVKESWEKYPELLFYEDHIWKSHKDHWLESFVYLRSIKKYRGYLFQDRFKKVEDLHPSPKMHLEWIRDNLADLLDISIDFEELDKTVNSIDDLYDSCGKNRQRLEFDNQLINGNFYQPKNMEWPNKLKGIF